ERGGASDAALRTRRKGGTEARRDAGRKHRGSVARARHGRQPLTRLHERALPMVQDARISAMLPSRFLVAPPLLFLMATSCTRERGPGPGAEAKPSARTAPSTRPPPHVALAGERVEIPGGTFFAGSVPGEEGRLPRLEPRRRPVDLGPFRIDRLPYPNDPKQPPLVGVSRDEAQRKCAERGARLCTELEWERACKGPNSDVFATGSIWDPRCAREPLSCASGFDVLAMGTHLREWTASTLRTGSTKGADAVVRGAFGAASGDHRCAGRRGENPETRADDLGFRCCAGAPNAAVVQEPKLGPTYRKVRLTADRLEAILSADPSTQAFAKDIKYFKEPEGAETVVARGHGNRQGMSFTVHPLLWNPAPGVEFLLVSARSGDALSFVVALSVLAEDEYRVAASFAMQNETGPV